MILKFMQYAQIKCGHGCSLCAWYYTSGGFQLPFRLTPKRHHQPFPCGSLGWAALRSRALSRSGTNQAHKLALEFNLTDYPSAYRKKQKNGS